MTTYRELDSLCVIESWHNAKDDLQCPSLNDYSFLEVNRKTSKNNHNYGAVIKLFSQTSFSSAVRLASRSKNIVWSRFKCENTFSLLVLYILRQKIVDTPEDTRLVLHEETHFIKQKFPGDVWLW